MECGHAGQVNPRHPRSPVTKSCAYCDGPGPFTRDHVWSNCFLERIGRKAAHFSQKAQRVHGADYVVGDVCATCNNQKLTGLDSYFCQLYDRYFLHARDFDTELTFEFDYELLARVLLKIAYNSARAAGSDPTPLAAVRSYISTAQPAPAQLAVFAELVAPTVVADAGAPSGTWTVLPTDFYRSAITKLLTPHGDDVHTRIVAVGSFYFHLVLPARALSEEEFHVAVGELGQYLPGTTRLLPTATSVQLRTSPQDAISSISPHIKEHSAAYEKFFRNRKS